MRSTEILEKYWGFSSFRGIQEDIVNASINGHDVLALLPTGGGKSICYQVPGMAREGICIVISPLIALMQDQVDNLKARGIRAKAIISGMSKREIDITLDNAKFGSLDFLYVSPERLKSSLFITRLKQMQVALFAIDEAHCISQWGHDFRPAYREIAKVREYHPSVPIIAVTATATTEVREDIVNQLSLNQHHYFEGNFARKNISYELYTSQSKLKDVLDVCEKFKGQTGIVYCQTRRETKEIAKLLHNHKHSVAIYHGGLTGDRRKQIQNEWINDKTKVIVATNAFGMGIDKPDVRFVVHYQLPNSIEAYFQEAGRAGRDGKQSRTFGFYNTADIKQLKYQTLSQFPEVDFIKSTYRALCNYVRLAIGSGLNETYPFHLSDFIKKYNLEAIPTYNALKILELNGDLVFNEAVYHPTRFKFAVSNNAVYSFQVKYDAYADLITWLSRSYAGVFSEFVKIEEDVIAKRLKITESKLEQQLKFLETHGIIDIQWSSDLPQVTFIHERLPDDYLRIKTEVYNLRKKIASDKLNAIIQLVRKPICRSVQILAYFDQKGENCGICDICISEKKADYSNQELIEIIKDELKQKTYTLDELYKVVPLKDKHHLQYIINYLCDEKVIVEIEQVLQLNTTITDA
ncbi:MAG: RecQ family ATP-dependent DNA helicase [Lishizhenia sp.]